jgi:hypothetical protein
MGFDCGCPVLGLARSFEGIGERIWRWIAFLFGMIPQGDFAYWE